MKYRKIPVDVNAFQMTKERRWDNQDWPEWLNMAWNTEGEGSVYCVDGGEELFVGTLNGVTELPFGDWIIQRPQGDIYPCNQAVFEQTYEPVP